MSTATTKPACCCSTGSAASPTQSAASCHTATDAAHTPHAHAGASWSGAASATVHCLTGCALGEFLGLAIGVHFGWSPMSTMLLATALAFVTGYAFTLVPFVRRGVRLADALRTVWLGELISITAMEIAMNATDYSMGGMSVSSLSHPWFWASYATALGAGFLAAWPINYLLLKRNLKNCH